ncbi:MAG TPA: hypothetical protein VFB14_23965 [Bryobacteraceae bacterium]|nr:hypothetical protein [Bryobacteraceae bacterium]
MRDLIAIPEPCLLFGHGQATEDPRDGLTLFGPLDKGKPYGVRAGVIGTKRGIEQFHRWVEWVQRPVLTVPPTLGRPPFPGFETVFCTPWSTRPLLTIEVGDEEIDQSLYLDEPHERVYGTVSVYAERLLRAKREEEEQPELWFVVVPDRVWKYCRPSSVIEPELRQQAVRGFRKASQAKSFWATRSLFPQMEEDATPYVYEEQFHNQLKARLLKDMLLTQIVKESTIANISALGAEGSDPRQIARQSEIAWNLCTAVFYKVGGRPWKVAGVRAGVCYLGLVFKRDETGNSVKNACCAAQMFLDSGDGVVFKGAVGPWYSPDTGDFHLTYAAAKELGELAIDSYRRRVGVAPKELFIHGRVRFEDDEWFGFRDAAGSSTNMVGVRIRPDTNLKLYRKGQNPVLRGLAHVISARKAYLWTKGWTPRLQTYPGREVPNPLSVEISRGDAQIGVVLQDIVSLTKLNYNTCIFGDGAPITLKFANAVGEILTAGPMVGIPPLPFSHYI